jgi:hypothetical protein
MPLHYALIARRLVQPLVDEFVRRLTLGLKFGALNG